jgi:hypothetical protein
MRKLLGSTAYLTSLKTIVWWVINQSDKSKITIENKFINEEKKMDTGSSIAALFVLAVAVIISVSQKKKNK